MTLRDITTEAVRKAMAEFDSLGRDRFLQKYGFGKARDYFVVGDDGRRYDSKAIVGAAHGYLGEHSAPLGNEDFSGGEAKVAKILERLGFVVERLRSRRPGMGVGSEPDSRIPAWSALLLRMRTSLQKPHFKPLCLLCVVEQVRSTGSKLFEFEAIADRFDRWMAEHDASDAGKAWEPFFHLSDAQAGTTGAWALLLGDQPAKFEADWRPKRLRSLQEKADRAVLREDLYHELRSAPDAVDSAIRADLNASLARPEQMGPIVLVENERTAGGQYDHWQDATGERYQFPNSYKNKVRRGRRFVYYRGARRADDTRAEPDYFGHGIIGEVYPDPETDRSTPKRQWKWCCDIEV